MQNAACQMELTIDQCDRRKSCRGASGRTIQRKTYVRPRGCCRERFTTRYGKTYRNTI